MKTKIFLFLLIAIGTLFLVSCEDKEEVKPNIKAGDITDEEYTNQWIYNRMKSVYLWNESMPTSPSLKQDSEKYFYEILYKHDQIEGDRFSWIEEDKSKTKSTRSFFGGGNLGFDFIPTNYIGAESDEYTSIGYIIFWVDPISDAAKHGLERGNIIYAVNGVNVTYDNYQTLLTSASTQFTFSVYNKLGKKAQLPQMQANPKVTSPIFLSKIIESDGKRIAYLMYNQFERNADDNDENFDYDIELIESIRNLNNKGIDEFVLDLRYNPGGYVTSAMDLASALVPNRNINNILIKESYNKFFTDSLVAKYKSQDIFNEYFLDKVYGTTTEIPRLNLGRLYIIAGNYSASASELVLHCLKPYMTVYHIGETTVGKDKGSITIKAEGNNRIKWQLQPLVMRLTDVNNKGNYINGLQPDFMVSEMGEGYKLAKVTDSNGATYMVPYLPDWLGGLSTLGSPEEPLLAEAIAQITGKPRKKSAKSSIIDDNKVRKAFVLKRDESRYRTIVDHK